VDVVVKGSKVLDFVSTIVILHLASCWVYGGSLNWPWILAYGTWGLLVTLVGEFTCLRFEQRESKLTDRLFKNHQL